MRTLYWGIIHANFSANQLVFVDETHAKPEDLRRKYGYSITGTQAIMRIRNVAHGDSPAVCGICALSLSVMLAFHIVEDNVNADMFMDALEHYIIINMNPFPLPCSVLVLDNASTHDMLRIAQLCDRFHIIIVPLPTYSYDFNPLELALHQSKEYVRIRYGVCEGTIMDKLAEGFNQVNQENAINYYRHCGYEVHPYDIQAIAAIMM